MTDSNVPSPPSLRPDRRADPVIALGLVVWTVALYFRVHDFGFVNYDDDLLLIRNAMVNTGLSGENVAWAFTSLDKLQYAPFTWLTHQLDFTIFGQSLGGHHLVSLGWHTANTLLLYAFLRAATGARWRPAIVAALFAVHPLHVEPVAWLSARKDLVSTAGFFLALVAWVRYVRRPTAGAYLATFAALAFSLGSKAMYVTFPVVLLLLDHWPFGRAGLGARKLVVEKLPLFALSVLGVAAGYLAQSRSSTIRAFSADQASSRASTIVGAVARYVERTVWPADLAIIYPRSARPVAEVVLLALLLLGATVATLALARRRPYLVVGWLWFLVILSPVSGVVEIGPAWMADKHVYAAVVGLFIALTWGSVELAGTLLPRTWQRPALAAGAAMVLSLFTARSAAYLAHWRDGVSIFAEAVSVTEGNYLAFGNLGVTYLDQKRLTEARAALEESVRIEPRFGPGHANLGALYLFGFQDCSRAVPHLLMTLQLDPTHANARMGLRACGIQEPR